MSFLKHHTPQVSKTLFMYVICKDSSSAMVNTTTTTKKTLPFQMLPFSINSPLCSIFIHGKKAVERSERSKSLEKMVGVGVVCLVSPILCVCMCYICNHNNQQ